MGRRAQGLPITTIILAILGIVVLVILFAITTGRLSIFSRGVSECPGECVGMYTTDASLAQGDRPCAEGYEKQVAGNFIEKGQPIDRKARELVKCSRCCVPLV